MIIYSASILFHKNETTNNVPAFGTKICHNNIDALLDICELSAGQNKLFPVADVHINCVEVNILENGTAIKLNSKVRSFNNYQG